MNFTKTLFHIILIKATVVLFSNFSLANNYCTQFFKSKTTHFSIEATLDCLSQAEPLPKIGAQWILLKKSNWAIKEMGTLSLSEFEFKISSSPTDPIQKHHLYVTPIAQLNKKNQLRLLTTLENEVFPRLIHPTFVDPERLHAWTEELNGVTEASFVSNFHRHIALAASYSPLRRYSHFSHDLKNYQLLQRSYRPQHFSTILESDPLKARDWDLLWNIFEEIYPCNTNCLEKLESNVVRGSFLMLSHHQIVQRMEEQSHPWLGCNESSESEYSGSHFPSQVKISNVNQSDFEAQQFIGLPVYFEAIYQRNEDKLDNPNYRGMNGVIRATTLDGFRDYKTSFLSFGADVEFNSDKEIAQSQSIGIKEYYKDFSPSLSGLSLHLQRYWEFRSNLEKNNQQNTTAKNAFIRAKLEAREIFLNPYPFLTETTFEPTSWWTESTLAQWIEKLYLKNPQTPYQIYAYNYAHWDYYDQLFSVIESFPALQNINRLSYPKPRPHSPSVYRYTLREIINLFTF